MHYVILPISTWRCGVYALPSALLKSEMTHLCASLETISEAVQRRYTNCNVRSIY